EDADVATGARLGAARAAIARGDHAAARSHLAALDESQAALRAIALAELALDEHRPTDALVALDAPAAQPLPPRGLALRAEAMAANGQAAQAYGLLGTLRQQQALPAARLDELQERWAEAALREAGDANVLADRWESLPKTLRNEPGVVDAYAERAAALRWDEAATRALEQALDARWDETLAARYGTLPIGRLEARRTQAERWLQTHPASPALPGCGRWAGRRARKANGRRRRTTCTAPSRRVPAATPGKTWATASPRSATSRSRASAMRMPCAPRAVKPPAHSPAATCASRS